jgi:hypothetical protein
MGGVLDFAVFKDADGTEEEILSAVPQALYNTSTYDREKLRSLGNQRITERTFFGDWYDYASGLLLKGGTWKTADGLELENPPLGGSRRCEHRVGRGRTRPGPWAVRVCLFRSASASMSHPCVSSRSSRARPQIEAKTPVFTALTQTRRCNIASSGSRDRGWLECLLGHKFSVQGYSFAAGSWIEVSPVHGLQSGALARPPTLFDVTVGCGAAATCPVVEPAYLKM